VRKKLFKKFIYSLFNISIILLKVNANQISLKNSSQFNQSIAQINWEKVKENNDEFLKWEIDKNKKSIYLESYFQEGEKNNIDLDIDKNNININLESSPSFLNRERVNLDFGFMNDKFDFYIINFRLSKIFNIDFSSELINSKNNVNNTNKFKSTFLEKGSRNFRGGGTFQLFSKSKEEFFSTNIRLSYGENLGASRHGYIFSEIINEYSINNWLSFNVNPKFSFTSMGNVNSISSSLKWRLNPKFEIIPEANINLNNAENNFSLTGRTLLSENIILDTFVSNSFGVNDMAKQFKSENTTYGVNLEIRLFD